MREYVLVLPDTRPFGRRGIGLGLLALMAGCSTSIRQATGSDTTATEGGARMPRPARVLVYDFAIDWQTVALDNGMRARIQRAMTGGSLSQQQQEVAAEVQRAIGDTLVQQIQGMGLDAVRANSDTAPGPTELAIRGQITRIDAGNQTRRRLIGFGAGKSEIYAEVEVFGTRPGKPRMLLQSYDAEANSGDAPGLALGGAGAAAGHVATGIAGGAAAAANRSQSDLPDDGKRLARRVARNLGQFFYQEGWILAPASR